MHIPFKSNFCSLKKSNGTTCDYCLLLIIIKQQAKRAFMKRFINEVILIY